jgi:hypothetical protein
MPELGGGRDKGDLSTDRDFFCQRFASFSERGAWLPYESQSHCH